MRPLAQPIGMVILLNSLIPSADKLGGVFVSSIRITLPGNHKNKLTTPSSSYKMVIHHLLNNVCIICGGYGPLTVIPTGNRVSLHIMYIRLKAECLEDLEATGLPTLVSDDLISISPHPAAHAIWTLPCALDLIKPPVIGSDSHSKFITLLESLGLVLGCQIPRNS